MSGNSPYARKVRVMLRELGKAEGVEESAVNPRDSATGFWDLNPVGKIPALALDNGVVIVESDLVCRYLDARLGDGVMHRSVDGDPDRLHVLGLAQGILDKGMVARVEKQRPGGSDQEDFVGFHLDAVCRALDALEGVVVGTAGAPDMADIAAVCAADWISFRHPDLNIFETRPRLAAWVSAMNARPAFAATRPG
ncbi:hypothetical protein A3731_08140 [Roseovarius sp. HI0049]|nr:hypothetical protein A3731_08140 [Roseovarius sp. HI0049]